MVALVPSPKSVRYFTIALPEPRDTFTLAGRLVLLSLNFITIFPPICFLDNIRESGNVYILCICVSCILYFRVALVANIWKIEQSELLNGIGLYTMWK